MKSFLKQNQKKNVTVREKRYGEELSKTKTQQRYGEELSKTKKTRYGE